MARKPLIVNLALCMLALWQPQLTLAAEPENEHFIETLVKKTENGQGDIVVRQLCLRDQSLKIDEDVVAIINKASGKVMADKGKGFITSPVGTFLKEGNRVITLDESETEIVFFDCCKTALKSNNMITIQADPGCKAAILDALGGQGVPATVHPASYIAPAVGAWIILSISLE